MKDRIEVSGVMLRREGAYAVVEVEVGGKWVEVIREFLDANFSHIVEPGGIRNLAATIPLAINPQEVPDAR